MAFSGAVKLGDLNDFIAPSQACVVNLAPNAKLDAMDLQVRKFRLLLITLPRTELGVCLHRVSALAGCAGGHGAAAANP